MNGSTSQRSWRQNLAQGEASAASGTLGHSSHESAARFSGRKNLSPAKAGFEIKVALILEKLVRDSLPSLALRAVGDNAIYFAAGSEAAASSLSGDVLEILTSHYPMFTDEPGTTLTYTFMMKSISMEQ